jgi:hypothetical protein
MRCQSIEECSGSSSASALILINFDNRQATAGSRGVGIGEFHTGAALVPPKPAARDGTLDPGAEVVTRAACRLQRPMSRGQ